MADTSFSSCDGRLRFFSHGRDLGAVYAELSRHGSSGAALVLAVSGMSTDAIKFENDALVLRLYIQPKASRDQIVGLHSEELKVAITAPPVDGQANAHLQKFIAKQFRVAKSQVMIEKGELGRHKQVRINQPQQIPDVISALCSPE